MSLARKIGRKASAPRPSGNDSFKTKSNLTSKLSYGNFSPTSAYFCAFFSNRAPPLMLDKEFELRDQNLV